MASPEVKAWARRVKRGTVAIEDVPERIRDEVRDLI